MSRYLTAVVVIVLSLTAVPTHGVGAPFDVEAATEAYLSTLTPEEREASDRYFEGGYWLQLWSVLLTVGVAWLLLRSRLSARIRDLVERLTRFKSLQTAFYVAVYGALVFALFFPFALYRDFFRERQYGLATQSFMPWLGEQVMGLLVTTVLLAVLAVPVYGVIRRSKRHWWVWASIVTALFLAFATMLAPVFISPMFNEYTTLEEGPVKDAVVSLAHANGVPAEQVYQYDASRQTTRVSANVSGFMGTLRISLSDNLLERGTLEDIKAVVAHEIGHYVLNHAYEGLIYLSLVMTLGFAVVKWASTRLISARGDRWGVRSVGDLAGLPALVGLFSVYLFLMTPVVNTIIRSNEIEADLFGINASSEPDGRARTAMMHAEDRKVDPGPIEEWLFFDHPSGRHRVRMAMRWKAEHLEPEE